jgi:hypothetical protein
MSQKELDVLVVVTALALAVLCFVGVAFAAQPDCTGDRHYDGVACCPAAPPVTTTTAPPAVACPDPAPCAPVTCTCESTETVVQVDRCPEAPNYVPCRRKRDGTLRCPRPKTPRRVLAPEGR